MFPPRYSPWFLRLHPALFTKFRVNRVVDIIMLWCRVYIDFLVHSTTAAVFCCDRRCHRVVRAQAWRCSGVGSRNGARERRGVDTTTLHVLAVVVLRALFFFSLLKVFLLSPTKKQKTPPLNPSCHYYYYVRTSSYYVVACTHSMLWYTYKRGYD